MKKVILFCLMLASCVQYKETVLPNGKIGYTVTCSAGIESECFRQSMEACPSGYKTVGTAISTIHPEELSFLFMTIECLPNMKDTYTPKVHRSGI